MESDEGVDHGTHGDEGEEAGRDAADSIAEVEEADGEASEDDGEVEPGDKGALVGEEDFGLHAGGESDALPWLGGRESMLAGRLRFKSLEITRGEGRMGVWELRVGSWELLKAHLAQSAGGAGLTCWEE
jgi:hypothetical protein